MNKKIIIAAIVGGLLLFIWQWMSWSFLNVHQSEMQHTPNQEAVLACLSENLTEGSYFIPNLAEGASSADKQVYMESQLGKPWAQIHFHEKLEMKMGMNMIRGLTMNIMVVAMLAWILLQFRELTFIKAIMTSFFVGVTGYGVIAYLNHVWLETEAIGYAIDTIVQWGLCGIWLGWFLTRD